MEECADPECARRAAVRIHDPRGPDRVVCVAHARTLATRDGVVAEPLASAEDEWP